MSEIREKMWKDMVDSPFLMIGLNGSSGHRVPMSAQLDKDADSAFWFYTTTDSRIAPGGPAMAQFVSKDHDLFACIGGNLVRETDPAIIDKYWSRHVAAWYDGGRDDPSLLMLRFDLGDAEIWTAEPGMIGKLKLAVGAKMTPGELGEHATINL